MGRLQLERAWPRDQRNVATVLALADDSVLYGGQFPSAGGVTANGLALWTGSSFSGALGGIAFDTVYGLAQSGNGNISIGGDVRTVGGVPVVNVAQWHDGSQALGMGGKVTPWTSRDRAAYIPGREILVSADGTFSWSRPASPRADWRVYVTAADGLRSNTVAIRRR